MAKTKFYVVFEGKEPGIYKTWAECQKQVNGVKGSKFKSFATEEEAREEYERHISHEGLSKKEIEESISVDVSCRPSPGVMEYRVVHTVDENIIFSSKEYPLGTNNIGEFLALVKGMQIVKENECMDQVIFADSQTAMSWVKKKRVNTSLVRNDQTKELYDEVEKAEQWLQTINVEDFKIVKWESHIYGEIAADYGRKTKR